MNVYQFQYKLTKDIPHSTFGYIYAFHSAFSCYNVGHI